jgi:hypothetical protein
VNTNALKVLRQLVREKGEKGSGASTYYAQRLEQGRILTSYEVEVASYLAAHRSHYNLFCEVGCGFGVLPMLLAMKGLSACGFDPDERRIAGAKAMLAELRRALEAEQRPLDTACDFEVGMLPDWVVARKVEDAVAIVTNFTTTVTAPQRQDMIGQLARFKAVILDAQRFVERRATPEAENQLVAELQPVMGPARQIANMGDLGNYFLFTRAPQ